MKDFIKNFVVFLIIFITSMLVLLPIIWTFLNSFKYFKDIVTSNILFSEWTNINYWTVLFSREENIRQQLVNSLIYVVVTLSIVMPVATLAGYGLARLPHAIFYKTFALNFLIFSRILPATSLALPYFVIFSRANMYDTYISLIFIYVLKAIPLAIFMIMTFIEEVPIEIEESASIDGASMFYILVKIVFPLIAPGVAATAIFIFMYTWNDYLFVAFLTGKNAANLQIGIAQFNAEYFIKWGELCAAIIIAILPILLFTIAVQKYLVRGLTMGALKK